MQRDQTETVSRLAPEVGLSTKVTMIVFWGLIIIGLLLGSLLLHNRGLETLDQRVAIADSIAYQVYQLLHEHAPDSIEVKSSLQRLLTERGAVSVELRLKGHEIALFGAKAPGADAQRLVRYINVAGDSKDSHGGELAISFPSIEQNLHQERSRLLLSLGGLLLVFGAVLRGLMERLLALPLAEMVQTARAISIGHGELNFNAERHDEFGYLAKFINQALFRMRGTEREAQRLRELAEVTLQSIGDGVITTNKNGRIVYMNPVAERLLEMTLEDASGQFLPDIMPMIVEATGTAQEHPMLRCLRENCTVESRVDNALFLRSGKLVPIDDYTAPIHDPQGAIRGAVIVFQDVSEERKLQRELSYQASHDPLTGLYNRREFDREIQRALEYVERDGHVHALCYLDLDQFKVVNDTCGHAAGDQLLIKLTAYLQGKLRKVDVLARLGGDEFGLLLVHCPLQRALEIAESLRVVVNEFRFVWLGKAFQVGVSIGLVELTPSIGSAAEALAAADMACYAAKDDGRNRIHIYRQDSLELTQRREEMGMVSAVQSALADGHLELFAQSIAPVNEAMPLPHYEILVRMRDPQGNYISPGAFIPAAERFQLMSSLDRWVVSHAMRLASAQAYAGEPIELSINLSGQSLSEDLFLDFVLQQIEQSGVNPGNLCFEITETAAINNMARAVRFMTSIRKLGCHFALDDFGSGMSSFGYLKSLPVDILKIDGNFIKRLHESAVDQSMVRAIHEVARLMGMKTVAEFVENAEILQVLRDIGIDRAQGYFLGRPTPISELFPKAERSVATTVVPQLKVIRS